MDMLGKPSSFVHKTTFAEKKIRGCELGHNGSAISNALLRHSKTNAKAHTCLTL